MKVKWTSLTLSALLLLCACENALMRNEKSTDPRVVFEDLWQTLDKKYSFFTYKNINWDSLHEVYRPKIEAVQTEKAEFEVLSQLLDELKDGHVNLHSPFATSANVDWYCHAPENFKPLMVRQYLGKPIYKNGGITNSWIGNQIAYLYIPSFEDPLNAIDTLFDRYENSIGMIVDVRNNGGGFVESAQRLGNRFAKTRRLVLKEFFKKGPGHDDFTRAHEIHTQPWGKYYDKPVVVLTNRRCYSATSYFCVLMKALPRVTMLGNTTGGGSGIPMDYTLVNNWKVNFPASYSTDAKGFNFEYGVPPDITMNLKRTGEKDDPTHRVVNSYIEEAIKIILTHQLQPETRVLPLHAKSESPP